MRSISAVCSSELTKRWSEMSCEVMEIKLKQGICLGIFRSSEENFRFNVMENVN